MRAYRAQADHAHGRESGRRAEVLPTFAQRVLALQRSAGNAVVARAVEEERHEHGAACGHETAGQPLVENPSAHLAGEVTDRIWPCVELQYNWLLGEQMLPERVLATVVSLLPARVAADDADERDQRIASAR